MKRVLLRSSGLGRERRYQWAHPESTSAIGMTLDRLSDNAMQPALRTHKLRRPLQGCSACSGGYDLRIVFQFTTQAGQESILLLALGSHGQVY